MVRIWIIIICFQADSSIVDSKGVSHPVHSTLLRLKIPLFRYMDMGSSSTIVMDCASPDVVDLICQLVYNMDRSIQFTTLSTPICFCVLVSMLTKSAMADLFRGIY